MDLINISNEIWIKHRDAGGAVAFLVYSILDTTSLDF